MEEHKAYPRTIEFNGTVLTSIVISQHYKAKHADVTDELILGILELLVHGRQFDPEDAADEDGFQYFKIEPLEFQDRPYRLILVTCSTEDYLGVVNAFRVERKK